MSRPARLVAAAVLVVAACSGGGDAGTVTGVVIDVVGDLTSVESFTLRLDGGLDRTFEPAQGVVFGDGAPLSHLSDHLLSGEPVSVLYRTRDDGTLIALEVRDA